MAASLNSLFFVFKMSSLPKYRVMYYYYIAKWFSGEKCNWCVSLDIAKMLALILIKTHQLLSLKKILFPLAKRWRSAADLFKLSNVAPTLGLRLHSDHDTRNNLFILILIKTCKI